MTATSYNGVVNTNEEWENLATLTEITFEKDTIYSIQIQNPAWLKVGENGVPFLFNRDIPFPWKAKEDTDLYIKTTGQNIVLSIDTDTGFFLNKSGGGTTINNEDITVTQNGEYTASTGYTGLGTVTVNVPNKADLLTDEVTRTVTTKSRGRVPAQLTGVTQTGGTMTDDFVYTCASGAYLMPNEVFPLNSADTWELQFKYTYANKTNENLTGDDYTNPCLFIGGDRKLSMWLSSNGTSWDITGGGNSTVALVNGTTYYCKFGFDGTKYYINYNTDGSDVYLPMNTVNSTAKVYTGTAKMRFANADANGLTSRYCTGQLDLKNLKLYINGNLYWQAVTPASEWQDL